MTLTFLEPQACSPCPYSSWSQLMSCPTGGFSETYAALCDYNGLHCREEVQWVRWAGSRRVGRWDPEGEGRGDGEQV